MNRLIFINDFDRWRPLFIYCFLIFILFFQFPNSYCQQNLSFKSSNSRKVNCVNFSPDSRFLVSAHSDNTFKVWDLEYETFKGKTKASEISILSALYSKDQRYIITGGMDGKLKRFPVNENQFTTIGEHSEEHKGGINSLALSPDGEFVMSGSSDGSIKLWGIKTSWLQKSYNYSGGEINSVCFHPTGKYFASGDNDGLITLWGSDSESALKQIGNHNKSVNSVFFSSSGDKLASCGADSIIKVWDMSTGNLIYELRGHKDVVNCVVFSPEDKFVISGSNDGTVIIWDIYSGKEIYKIAETKTYVQTVSVSPDNTMIAFGTFDGLIYLFDIQRKSLRKIFYEDNTYLTGLEVSNESHFVLTVAITGIVRFWDLSSGRSNNIFNDNESPVNSLAISPDDKYAALGCHDGVIRLYDIKSDKLVNELTGHTDRVITLLYSEDGQFLFSGSKDKSAIMWDIRYGTIIKRFNYEQTITSVEYDKAKNLLYTGTDDGYICKWDITSGDFLHSVKAHSGCINELKKFHNSNEIVSCSSDRYLKIWNGNNLEQLFSGLHNWVVSSLDISSDDSYVVSGSFDCYARIWNVNNSILHRNARADFPPLSEGDNIITGIKYTKDQKYIIYCSSDGTLKVVNHQNELVVTMRAIGENEYIIYTPDNYYTSSKNGYKYVNFKEFNKEYPLLQFDIKYNRPDIIIDRLGYADKSLVMAYEMAYERRIKKMNIDKTILEKSFSIPELKIEYLHSGKKRFDMTVFARDDNYRLDKLNIFVNGVPIYGRNGKSLIDKKTFSTEESVSFELSYGRNYIEVSVSNELGVESLRETIEYYYEEKEMNKPDLYIFTIGISSFKDDRFGLNYSSIDADYIGKFFNSRRMEQNSYGKISVLSLLDKDATKKNILLSKGFLEQAKVDDEIIVYISCQGFLDKHLNYFFAPYDMDFSNYSKKGLSIDELESLLDNLESRKKILLIQASNSAEKDEEEIKMEEKKISLSPCEAFSSLGTEGMLKICQPKSAGLLQTYGKLGLKNSIELVQELFLNVNRGSGTVIISATSGTEFAIDNGYVTNSIFAYTIIEGLSDLKSDYNNDGIITVSEFKDYVTERVKLLTQNLQKVSVKQENIINDFYVWR